MERDNRTVNFDIVESKLNHEAKSYLDPALIVSLKKSYEIHHDLKNHFIRSEKNSLENNNLHLKKLSNKYNIKIKNSEKDRNVAFLFKLILRNVKIVQTIGM